MEIREKQEEREEQKDIGSRKARNGFSLAFGFQDEKWEKLKKQ